MVGLRSSINVCVVLATLGCSDARVESPPDGGSDGGGPSYRLEGEDIEGELVGGTMAMTYEIRCGPTEVVIGHDGGNDTDGYPDWYTLHCAQLEPDGTLTGERLTPSIAANPAGCGAIAEPWVQRCPDGAVAVGIHGATVRFRTGDEIVGRMGLLCAPLEEWTRAGTGAVSLPETTRNMDTALRPIDSRCAAGQVLTQLSGNSGCLVDSVRIGCRRVVR